jgi:hypothetical protein
VAVGSNWSDGTKWLMGIVAAILVGILVAKINRSPTPVIEVQEKQIPSPVNPPAIDIAGYWQAPPYNVLIVQSGNQLQVGFYGTNGALASSCKGSLAGNSMLVDCTMDNVHWGRYTAGLTPGTRRIELTTFTNGYTQQFVITR